MKKFISLCVALLVAGLTFANMGGKPDAMAKSYTVTELKAIYGDNIQLGEGVSLADDVVVTMVDDASPCDGSSFEPCGKAAAQAHHYAQQAANACCCVITFGYECCDPDTGAELAVLFIAVPRNGNCN